MVLTTRLSLRPRALCLPPHHRPYATHQPSSRHAQWYSDMLPPMIPIFLLGSAIYLGLQLTQLKLAHEKYMDDSTRRIGELEAEIAALRENRLAQPPNSTSTPAQQTSSTKKRSWW